MRKSSAPRPTRPTSTAPIHRPRRLLAALAATCLAITAASGAATANAQPTTAATRPTAARPPAAQPSAPRLTTTGARPTAAQPPAAPPTAAQPSAAHSLPAPVACTQCWHPALVTSWQWQLNSVPAAPYLNLDMFDIDMFSATAADVQALHTSKPGRKVVCYLDAGTWEPDRPDASQFPAAIKGKSVDGFATEHWLDIRQYNGTLGTIMKARLDLCKSKGFDAVEPDNVDGYTNSTGFPLTAADELAYNTWFANQAHSRGLSVGLKNDNEQIPNLLPYYDWALNEQCWQYSECTTAQNGDYGYDQFVNAGKAVFQVEYKLQPSQFCAKSNAQNFNSLKKPSNFQLTADRTPCRGI
jgi:hypothetical protein